MAIEGCGRSGAGADAGTYPLRLCITADGSRPNVFAEIRAEAYKRQITTDEIARLHRSRRMGFVKNL